MEKKQIKLTDSNKEVSKEAKKRFKRAAYSGTQIAAKSYSQHILDRFMEVK